MKNITKLLLVLSVVALGLASCSKEKRIEKQLYSKSGKWNNTLYDYKYYDYGSLEDAITYLNAGYIEFEKDGSYTWVFSADGVTQATNGQWSNTENSLTITGPNGTTVVWKILEESKKEMKIEYTEIEGSEKEVYTLTYEKVK